MPPIIPAIAKLAMRKLRSGSPKRARGEIVFGDRQECATDQGVAIQELQPDDHNGTGHHRQPELLVERIAIADAARGGERLRFGAPFDRRHLLDHQRESERGEHVQMLIQLAQHRPHGDDLGDHANRRARPPTSA